MKTNKRNSKTHYSDINSQRNIFKSTFQNTTRQANSIQQVKFFKLSNRQIEFKSSLGLLFNNNSHISRPIIWRIILTNSFQTQQANDFRQIISISTSPICSTNKSKLRDGGEINIKSSKNPMYLMTFNFTLFYL